MSRILSNTHEFLIVERKEGYINQVTFTKDILINELNDKNRYLAIESSNDHVVLSKKQCEQLKKWLNDNF